MPAIVLLNPHRATEILKLLDAKNESDLARFWKERSFLYVMGNIDTSIGHHVYGNCNQLT